MCASKFVTAVSLDAHVRRAHTKLVQVVDGVPHACEHCDTVCRCVIGSGYCMLRGLL